MTSAEAAYEILPATSRVTALVTVEVVDPALVPELRVSSALLTLAIDMRHRVWHRQVWCYGSAL
jgi:hypothetical protein